MIGRDSNNKGLSVFSDGGSRGNPGRAACAFVAYLDGEEIGRGAKDLGIATNNQAEYEGIIIALGWLGEQRLGISDKTPFYFYLDSELAVKQLTGEYKIRDAKLRLKADEIRKLEKKLPSINWRHVRRDKNKLADRLLNDVLDGVSST